LATDFELPNLGENVTGGDVLRVMVKPGDVLAKEQPVLELETDKATIEVPSSVAGTVSAVKVKAGDKVTVGQVILTVDSAAAGPEAPAAAKPAPAAAPAAAAAAATSTDTSQKVGGDEPGFEQPVQGQKRPSETDKPGSIEAGQAAPAPAPRAAAQVVDINRGVRAAAVGEPRPAGQPAAPASPSVRRLARELGVDINEVSGSGPKDVLPRLKSSFPSPASMTWCSRGGTFSRTICTPPP